MFPKAGPIPINSTSPIIPAILAAMTTLTPQITKTSRIIVQIIQQSKGHYNQFQIFLQVVPEVIFQKSYYSLIDLISSLANSSAVLIIGTYIGSALTFIANLK